MNVQLTIGNTDPATFAAWMLDADPVFGYTIVEGIGAYMQQQEPCVVVTFWDVTEDTVNGFLEAYGIDHPEEESFGVMPLPESRLAFNPNYQS